jgi:hypothetical protein
MTSGSHARFPGLRGALLSQDALHDVVPNLLRGELDERGRAAARRRMRAWHLGVRDLLGPASAPRLLLDRLAIPLLSQLGYHVLPDTQRRSGVLRAALTVGGRAVGALIVTGWGADASTAWRDAVHHGIAHGVRWCYCVTGPALRIVDAVRTYSRQYVELDLATAIDDDHTFAVMWGLLRADAIVPGAAPHAESLFERAIAISEDHRASVRSSLQAGVDEALLHLHRAFSSALRSRSRAAPPNDAVFNEAIVVVYRVLFLLFAEARGLVPRWHPTYRDGYTIEALRRPIELLPRPPGLWETLQSIARLAHRGCRIGALRVTPFNGRLFSPSESPLAASSRLDEAVVRQALLALTTRRARDGRRRIAYGDLGVEQLGGVYERILELEPRAGATSERHSSFRRGERRKSTGSFYTPRALTEFLVRRTLAPLVDRATPEAILSLRVLDPAMGSGAFLVAACRYLATAYEQALVSHGGANAEEIDEAARADFRRAVAQRCLFGVDLNPMAVQLGRLSLWLATLAADRPLTFLDHRLRPGNSLIGAAPGDLARQAPGRSRTDRKRRAVDLPLFDDPARDASFADVLRVRTAIAEEPGDTLEQVHAKERALSGLDRVQTLTRWKDACDLWCSYWFRERARREPAPFAALADSLFGRGALPPRTAAPLLEHVRRIAARERFFHWPFEFPEVFLADRTGFDAVIGNPPWEMLRGDRGDDEDRDAARRVGTALTEFTRSSGIYTSQGEGHANLYQLFVERMAALVRRGGRLGVILPFGVATDQGAARLRRRLFDRMHVDTFVSLENRDAIFPIHRGLKFLLMTATDGARTDALPCRFGIRRPETLDALHDVDPDADAVHVPRLLLERLGGDGLAVPDVRCRDDVIILSRIACSTPALGDPEGWGVRFGRELNASDDRRYFQTSRTEPCLPVVEGKHLTPFAVDVDAARSYVPRDVARRILNPDQTFGRARLAYRDVASPTNRWTLIAAIVPAGVVTTHTAFCLKDPVDAESQLYLCGMFNSFVANYLVRVRVSTHVTAAIVGRLPMPRPSRRSPAYVEIVSLAGALSAHPGDTAASSRLHAVAAHLYGLTRPQFQRVLDTFPLVAPAERDAAMAAFCAIVT